MMARSFAAVGQTSGKAAHVVVCLPVDGLHRSLKAWKGTRTAVKASPAGTVKGALKQPREKGMAPPPAHAYGGTAVPEAKDTLKPVYEGVLERTIKTKSPAAAPEASGYAPSAAALMKPGALSEGTSSTVPLNVPNLPAASTDQLPLDRPPMTGSFSCTNLLSGIAPSKLTRGTSAKEPSSAASIHDGRQRRILILGSIDFNICNDRFAAASFTFTKG